MKKIIILLFLITCGLGLYAQTGLFNLSYALTFAEADSILNSHGFFAKDSGTDLVRFFPTKNKFIDAVSVFVEPKSKRIIGWFVKYNPENTEDNDQYIIKTISEMHGEKNHYDEDTEQLIWFLSTTRTVHVMYATDGGLTVLYYDSYFHDLFDLNKTEITKPKVTE
ncbi:MAG: hypothetical protein CVU50_01925 [Candidatus Cloacimonetes bacterium HGW-Cloacimonetes-3]|nr:MAG: hypothetical protein CVU50_01925 [Candidatus Cloacimonetes bacterium HGW-Cloacimonetes-3]